MSSATAIPRAELARVARQFPAGAFRAGGLVAAILGGALLFLLAINGHAERVWQAYFFNLLFWWGLATGSVIFAATQKLAKGHWAGLVIRLGEASVAFLPFGVLLFLGSWFGRGYLYSWITEPRPDIGSWLTPIPFYVRNGAILALLTWLAWRFVQRDMRPDLAELASGKTAEPDAAEQGRIASAAAILVVAWAFGMSLVAFDFVTAQAHKWVSNLYGAFYFMGSFLAGLMWLAVLSVWMRRRMELGELYSGKQQHDLAKLCFGFTVFWAYLMFGQYLVIWYGNLPEETYYIFYRLWAQWRPVGVAVFLMVFLIPFIGLLGVRPKKAPLWLTVMALVSLAGIWLERYLEIIPSINHGAGPALGLPEAAAALCIGGVYVFALGWFADRYPMVSPRLAADTLEREHH